ncbi:ATPase WRNIP1 isoform X2 [Erythrolamprus reginae]|uniref:ATPase WRNIP1 isoform X2 n=1 Tax=Erythrolamprus reginae TaxID=121349 RepID=UPI00396CF777
MEGGIAQEEPLVSCPVCLVELPSARINSHLDTCLQLPGEELEGRSNSASKPTAGAGLPSLAQRPCLKKMRLSQSPERRNKEEEPGNDLGTPPVFSLFHRGRNSGGAQAGGSPRGAVTSPNPGKGEERRGENPELAPEALLRGETLTQKLEGKPLADKLRPSHLGDYVGQNQALGKETLLRSLLEAHEIPSLILWGPPGCGKTTLAHIIASSSKKNGTRFVTLSATSAKTSDVRDVILQAQNEKRLCKRKTILFIDEIHRFNKSQQDTFLPHVECGTITLIGATTENPSFQVNSALLSRCRVIVLEKLSVEAMEAILMRAVKSLRIPVLSHDEELTSSMNANNSKGSELYACIERKAINTLAYLCDGDARTGLNGLQMAVQARLTNPSYQNNNHECSPKRLVITEDDVKEGLQRSHILYDRAGLADPLALPQAVAAYQGCHFIGMPECEVLLAQCVVYFARAPKSIEVYSAYSNVKSCLRNHQGPLLPVPLHLRNAPTKLMKNLGYGKGYKYNPMYKNPVEQEYLPEELKGIDFFTGNKI